MGYISEVILVVEKKLVGSLLTLFSQEPEVRKMFTESNPIQTNDTGDMMLHIDHIKWYSNYKEVQAIEKWMDNADDIDDNAYSFNRLGEEFGDHESRGFAEAWTVYSNQTLSVY